MSDRRPPDLDPEMAALLAAEREAPGPDDEAMARMHRRLAAALPAVPALSLDAPPLDGAATSGVMKGTAVKGAAVKGAAVKGAAVKGGILKAAALKGWIAAATLTAGGGALWALNEAEPTAERPAKAPVETPTAQRPTARPEPTPAPIIEPAPVQAAEQAPAQAAEPPAEQARPTPTRRARPKPQEPQILAAAIQALKGGDPKAALRALDRHRRLYPRGAQVEERERLAIKALLALGRVKAARHRLADFKARYPRALNLDRLEASVAQREKSAR